jgi:polyisoprenoid-binding protein YceI
MKNTLKNLTAVAFIALLTFSFTSILEGKKIIKTEKSKVTWKGYKVTGSHEGRIKIKQGSLTFKNNKLVNGAFAIDMKSITNTDLSDANYRAKLEGHLKSDDFFGVAKHPTATLLFTKVKSIGKNAYKIKGNLTIKGRTHAINFTLSVYGNKATASLKIDRTKYNVRYGSTSFFDGLKDKAIYDEFDLVVDLEF